MPCEYLTLQINIMQIVLNTYGTSISCDRNGFVVSHSDGKQRIPVQQVDSILIGKSSKITSDAVLLAIHNEIEVLFMDKTGHPAGRVWSNTYGSISTIRKGQLQFTYSQEATSWVIDLIRYKIDNQLALLSMMEPDNHQHPQWAKGLELVEVHQRKLDIIPRDSSLEEIAPSLRGIEGICSKIYFQTLNIFLPPTLQFEQRSQHPAYDNFNAMLNYAYGILYSKIEGALIQVGIDPYIGIFHTDNYNRPVLVYDIIERYRVWVDYVVYSLAIQDVMIDECFSQASNGSVLLEALGRRIVIQSVNDYLEETTVVQGINRTRRAQIQQYAYDLAKTFKSFEP